MSKSQNLAKADLKLLKSENLLNFIIIKIKSRFEISNTKTVSNFL